MQSDRHLDIAIVGGGISGLAVGFHLQAAGARVRVFEAADRVGGHIRSLHRDGVVLEQGPQSLRGAGPAIARLVAALGLQDRVIAASSASNKRYLLQNGTLRALPSGPLDLLRGGPIGLFTALRAALEPLQPRAPRPGESIDGFVRRRFGAGIADPVLDAFIAGIFAGDSTRTEAEAAFPALVQAERDHGSVLLARLFGPSPKRLPGIPRGPFTFVGGAETLTQRLEAALGDAVTTGCAVQKIEASGDRIQVVHADGVTEADQVIVCTPPHIASQQVQRWHDLAQIPASPVAAVHLGWRAGTGPKMEGFGWLSPTAERRDVLGCIWVSSSFPELSPGMDLLRVMIGGSRAPSLPAQSEAALTAHALEVVRQVQGPVGAPDLTQVATHHPGIPQYPPGHTARRREIESAVPRVHPLGWGLTGIGLSQGLAAAEDLAARLMAPPTPT